MQLHPFPAWLVHGDKPTVSRLIGWSGDDNPIVNADRGRFELVTKGPWWVVFDLSQVQSICREHFPVAEAESVAELRGALGLGDGRDPGISEQD